MSDLNPPEDDFMPPDDVQKGAGILLENLLNSISRESKGNEMKAKTLRERLAGRISRLRNINENSGTATEEEKKESLEAIEKARLEEEKKKRARAEQVISVLDERRVVAEARAQWEKQKAEQQAAAESLAQQQGKAWKTSRSQS